MCFPTGNRRFGWSELSPNAYTNGEPGIPGCFTRVIIKHTKKFPATAQPITVCDFGQKTKTENFVSLKFWKMCSKSMPKKCQTTATLAGVDFQVAQKVDFWDPPNTIKKCRAYEVSYWNWLKCIFFLYFRINFFRSNLKSRGIIFLMKQKKML